MIELNGKHGSAIVYTDDVEELAISQIVNLLNQPMAEGANVRIMPDVHAGSGCVIGYTAKITDKIVPNLIGVDIGCGVASWHLGNEASIGQKFDKLDKVIRQYVPSGRSINDAFDSDEVEFIYDTLNVDMSYGEWRDDVSRICKVIGQDEDYVLRSIGTLGGGNHFIEVDRDDNGELWLTIHSGSRNFGLKVAVYHQNRAEDSLFSISKEEYDTRVEEIKRTKKGKGIEVAIKALRQEASKKGAATGLEYLEGDGAEAYFRDMHIAQIYAQLNRRIMADRILRYRYKVDYFQPVESVHNYINFEDRVIRKGSISAHDGERVIIPLNMADGVIIGTGKGNDDWNNSAPHGSGRRMSRTKAKSNIRLEDFQARMKKAGVWSTSVSKATLDEAPQAYKKSEDIIGYLGDTVDVEARMFPVYNFKGIE